MFRYVTLTYKKAITATISNQASKVSSNNNNHTPQKHTKATDTPAIRVRESERDKIR